ncbi:tetratricopeptide repeat protein [Streptomyces sp. NPDC057654]|uniref:tetratricopeptide repeat protein n=1 Tax=Streptomyces sp. NPDC057654 TaxID=3346196 RepID=UPI003675D95B
MPPTDNSDDRSIRNTVSNSTLGTTIQARDITGLQIHTTYAAPPAPRYVPRQLLPAIAHFTDRVQDAQDLRAAHNTFCGTAGIVVISGPSGVGKTALATQWLRKEHNRFPDGQLYADLRGYTPGEPVRAVQVLARFLRAYGLSRLPQDEDELAALWRTVASGRRIAVHLDNAPSAERIRPLLPGEEGHLVVVTSRAPLEDLVDVAVFHRLHPLDPDASTRLIAQWIGPEQIAAAPRAAQDLVAMCGGLPLALRVAARHQVAQPHLTLDETVEALVRSQDPARPGHLLPAESPEILRALDTAVEALGPAVQQVYRLLGTAPLADLDPDAAAAVCGMSRSEVLHALTALGERNLLESRGADPTRHVFTLHDTVWAHARARAAAELTADQHQAALRRLLDWYVYATTAADALITPTHHDRLPRTYATTPTLPPPFTRPVDAMAWLRSQAENLMLLVHATGAGLYSSCWQLVSAMWPLFLHARLHTESVTAHELAIDAARRDASSPAALRRQVEREMRTSGAVALRGLGRYERARRWYERARDSAIADGDRHSRAQSLNGLGETLLNADRPDEAVPHFREARQQRRDNGDDRGVALCDLELGKAALATSHPDEAEVHLAQARAALLRAGDAFNAARALAYEGLARGHDDYTAGLVVLRAALAEFAQPATSSAHWQARTHEFIGQTAQQHADIPAARESYLASLAIYERLSPSDAHRVRRRLDELPSGTAAMFNDVTP